MSMVFIQASVRKHTTLPAPRSMDLRNLGFFVMLYPLKTEEAACTKGSFSRWQSWW